MSEVSYSQSMLETWKKEHPNHKCIRCKHRFVYAYEDDSPAGRSPYHWWLGTCEVTKHSIESDKLPPDDCPFEEKTSFENRI